MDEAKVREFVRQHRRVYTPTEVSYHNCAEDCWVSVFHKVYDVTDFIRQHDGAYETDFEYRDE